jgi:pilus assembly protein Flp/PilA
VKEVREFPIILVSRDEGRRIKAFDMFRKTESLTNTKERWNAMLNAIRQFVRDEKGAAAAEYALFLALITVALAATVGPLGTAISGVVTGATAAIS